MKENQERCCGACRWHRREPGTDEWVCQNPESDYGADYTGYEDSCQDWEGRR